MSTSFRSILTGALSGLLLIPTVNAAEPREHITFEMATGLSEQARSMQAAPAPAQEPRFRPRGSPEVRPQPPQQKALPPLTVDWPRKANEEKTLNLRIRWEKRPSPEQLLRRYNDALSAPRQGPEAAKPSSTRSPSAADTTTSSSGEVGTTATPWEQVATNAMRDRDGIHHKAGRVRWASYAYDHSQGLQTLWLGTSGGGLWKMVVAGLFAFWVPVSDTLPGSPSVGGFVVHPNNSSHILIGSGDAWRYSGTGMYRTTDGGTTWTRTNLSPIPSSFYKLASHSTTPDTVLAAADNGIYRSTDFGVTWTRVYTGGATDVAQDPAYPNYWYAGAPGIGILESSDHGATWHPINTNGGNGIPDPVGRVSIAVSRSAANYVYAVIEGEFGVMNGIYRSNNYGYDWARIDSTDTISWGQAFHTTAISVDPTTPDRLFVGMGGVQWTANATAASPCWNRNVGSSSTCTFQVDGGHADFTGFAFVPGSSTQVIMATDGGYYIYNHSTNSISGSGNRLGLNVLKTMGPNQSIAVARTDGTTFLTGLQDNGIARFVNGDLLFLGGGDGGQVSISPDNNTEFFFSSGVAYHRYYSTDQGASWNWVNCTLGNQWSPSMLRDPTPSLPVQEMFTHTDSHIWYKRVNTSCDWAQVNGGQPTPQGFAIKQFDQANNRSLYVFYATGWSSDRLYVMEGSTVGALAPLDRTPPLPTGSSRNDALVYADRSALQPNTVYYVTSGARPSRAFLSTNRGLNWTDVTGDLTTIAANASFLELVGNPANLNQLFMATDVGVFRSDNGGVNWYRWMEGLPAVVAAEGIELNYDNVTTPVLHIGTYGRGYWKRPMN